MYQLNHTNENYESRDFYFFVFFSFFYEKSSINRSIKFVAHLLFTLGFDFTIFIYLCDHIPIRVERSLTSGVKCSFIHFYYFYCNFLIGFLIVIDEFYEVIWKRSLYWERKVQRLSLESLSLLAINQKLIANLSLAKWNNPRNLLYLLFVPNLLIFQFLYGYCAKYKEIMDLKTRWGSCKTSL